MKNIILAFLIAGLLPSCATRSLDVDYDVPGALYGLSPEPLGELGRISASINGHISNDVELGGTHQSASIFSNNPGAVSIETDNPTLGPGLGIGVNGGLGIHQYIDLLITKSSQSLYQFGGKFCLIHNCAMEKEGWKFSLFGLFGVNSEDENSKDSWFSEGDNKEEYENVSAKLSQTGRTFGFSIGKRQTPRILYYFNGLYNYIETEAQVSVESGGLFTLDSRTENLSLLAGVRVNEKLNQKRAVFFYTEGGYGRLKFRGTRKQKRDGFIGAMGLGIYIF